jgi:hypothetical protein
MPCEFFFRNIHSLKITEVAVIGEFNNYQPKFFILNRAEDGWYGVIDLQEGVYRYKFLVNGILKLNDPFAGSYEKDKAGEVWSLAYVDKQRKRRQIQGDLHIELFHYIITDRIVENLEEAKLKRNFDTLRDSKIYAGFEFGNILGTNTITTLWINPNAELFHISDHVVHVLEGDENNATNVWFWLDLKDKGREYTNGIWQIELLINGELIAEERFQLGSGYIYSVTKRGVEIKYL